MALPDGQPLSIVSRRRGYRDARRVPGPDLMPAILKLSEEKGYTHYFYGSSEHTLAELRKALVKAYPRLRIVGMYAPPYSRQSFCIHNGARFTVPAMKSKAAPTPSIRPLTLFLSWKRLPSEWRRWVIRWRPITGMGIMSRGKNMMKNMAGGTGNIIRGFGSESFRLFEAVS